MRITVTGTRGFPGVQGGVENHCENIYIKLAEMGCDVTVFTRRKYVSPGIVNYKGVSLISVASLDNKFLEAFIHTFQCVLRSHKMKPDILHIHAIGPSFFAPLARLLGMKVVVTHHGPDYKRKKWPLLAKIILKFCERIGVTFANEMIVVAQHIADDIKKKFGRVPVVIPNGIDVPVFVDPGETLDKFTLRKGQYILAVGRFVPEKGFHDLIDAFNEGLFKNWKLVIVGSADHEDKYSSNLKLKASKKSDIVLTGLLMGKPLQELYSNAGLFVLSSYYEGLPIVLLEAMSYGLSCLASDIPANRNIELDEERYFKAGDIKMMAAKMKEFINKSWEEEKRKKQIKIIADKYNWRQIAEETMNVYKRVA